MQKSPSKVYQIANIPNSINQIIIILLIIKYKNSREILEAPGFAKISSHKN